MSFSLGLDPGMAETNGATATVREIAQQPRLWRETAAILDSRRAEVDAFLAPLLAQPDLRVVLTGAGTSAFAGEILAPGLSAALGRVVEALATTDIVAAPADAFAADRPTLLVSFARSGNSPESVAATALADQCLGRVHHLIVTCNRDGALFRRHEGAARSLVLLMPEGSNDEGFAMTSSVTTMMLATALAFATAASGEAIADRLADAAETIFATRSPAIAALARRRHDRIVYLGSGTMKGLAREAALKVLELTGGAALGYADTPLGFRHGPKALVDERTLAIVFLSNDPHARRYDLDILTELRRQIGPDNAVAIGAGPVAVEPDGPFWLVPSLAGQPDWQAALPFLVHAQLLALHASLARGRTPDNPFPSGEVNRVVQGVAIHPFAPER